MVVRGDELLFKSLFLKANTTLSAKVILFLFPFSFLSDHLDRTLVIHLNFHSSTCPIRHFFWLSVNGGD